MNPHQNSWGKPNQHGIRTPVQQTQQPQNINMPILPRQQNTIRQVYLSINAIIHI